MADPNEVMDALVAGMAKMGVSHPRCRSHATNQKMTAREQMGPSAPRMCTVCFNLFEGEDELVDHITATHRASRTEIKDQFQRSKKELEEKQRAGQNTVFAEHNLRINTLRQASLEKLSRKAWRRLRDQQAQ